MPSVSERYSTSGSMLVTRTSASREGTKPITRVSGTSVIISPSSSWAKAGAPARAVAVRTAAGRSHRERRRDMSLLRVKPAGTSGHRIRATDPRSTPVECRGVVRPDLRSLDGAAPSGDPVRPAERRLPASASIAAMTSSAMGMPTSPGSMPAASAWSGSSDEEPEGAQQASPRRGPSRSRKAGSSDRRTRCHRDRWRSVPRCLPASASTVTVWKLLLGGRSG